MITRYVFYVEKTEGKSKERGSKILDGEGLTTMLRGYSERKSRDGAY